jgi:hypothetical protein
VRNVYFRDALRSWLGDFAWVVCSPVVQGGMQWCVGQTGYVRRYLYLWFTYV